MRNLEEVKTIAEQMFELSAKFFASLIETKQNVRALLSK